MSGLNTLIQLQLQIKMWVVGTIQLINTMLDTVIATAFPIYMEHTLLSATAHSTK